MKRLSVLLLSLSLVFMAGCTVTDDTEATSGRMEETAPLTLPLDPEVKQSLFEASVSEEEELYEASLRWTEVDDVMHDVLNSLEFQNAETDEEKRDILIEAMKDLSLHGTERYPEPLIEYGSWKYIPEGKEVEARYSSGEIFSVCWMDYLSESTDIAG